MSKKEFANIQNTRLLGLIDEVSAETGKELITVAKSLEHLVAEVKNFLNTAIKIETSDRLAYRIDELPGLLGVSKTALYQTCRDGGGPPMRALKEGLQKNSVSIVTKEDLLVWLKGLPEKRR